MASITNWKNLIPTSAGVAIFAFAGPSASAFFPPIIPQDPPVTVTPPPQIIVPPVLVPPVPPPITVPPVSPPPVVVPPVDPPLPPTVLPPVDPPLTPQETPEPTTLVSAAIGLAALAGAAAKRKRR